jgi:hypothetical protein
LLEKKNRGICCFFEKKVFWEKTSFEIGEKREKKKKRGKKSRNYK